MSKKEKEKFIKLNVYNDPFTKKLELFEEKLDNLIRQEIDYDSSRGNFDFLRYFRLKK